MAADDDVVGEEESRRFRCLDAARYAVASVVTVLIVTVIVFAIHVVLRPDKLTLRVAGGSVLVVPDNNLSTAQGPRLICHFRLEAINPNGRAHFYYSNIFGTFLVKNTSTSPAIIFGLFKVPDMDVPQQWMRGTNDQVKVVRWHGNLPYFDKLYKNNSTILPVVYMDLKLNGSLTVGLYSVHNQTDDQQTIYYCSGLTVVVGRRDSSEGGMAGDNVECTLQDPSNSS